MSLFTNYNRLISNNNDFIKNQNQSKSKNNSTVILNTEPIEHNNRPIIIENNSNLKSDHQFNLNLNLNKGKINDNNSLKNSISGCIYSNTESNSHDNRKSSVEQIKKLTILSI